MAHFRLKELLRPVGRLRFLIEEHRYHDTSVLSPGQTNDLIARTLQDGAPHAVAKIGASELGGLRHYLRRRDRFGHCAQWGSHAAMLYANAGVFPADPSVFSRFCRTYLESLTHIDVLAVWFRWGERSITRRYTPQAAYGQLTGLEPYFHDRPWSQQLEGKRVLVLTPFAQTVTSQYEKRAKVWAKKLDVLPSFSLDTLRTPLSAALVRPQFSDWFTTLDHLREEMSRRTFDAAIIGAGAWSLPLAAHAKTMGKWAIHLGGPTQILFGIKGRRWDANEQFSRFFTNAWVRPGDADRPPNFVDIEGGCYW